jgi:protein O-GlcNAc transferase
MGSARHEPLPPAEHIHLVALFNVGRYAELESQARALAERYSNSGFVWMILGVALGIQGKDALHALLQATRLMPRDAEVHNNLGNAQSASGQLVEAVASYRRAIKLKPTYAEAHNNLGTTLNSLGKVDEAVTSCRRAIGIKADFAEAHVNLANALQSSGYLVNAMTSYRRALAIDPGSTTAYSNLLMTGNYLAEQSTEELLAEARRFDKVVSRKATPFATWSNAANPDGCLRVGLVSGDFREHAAGHFIEGAIAALASNAAGRLEFFAYSNHSLHDALTERIRACCLGWRSVTGLSDEQLARQIRSDGVDILIDLSGHTAHNRLPVFAWKPAPVQLTWLGYFATTGVYAVDYLIADPWTLPATEEGNFTEKIWRLPETRLCFTAPDVEHAVAPLPALSNGHITFGCFNNLTKVNDKVVALWAKVLAAVPHSRLFLKTKQLGEASAREEVTTRFAMHDIEAGRLILEGPSPRANYLEAYHRVDIALDPFPFTGGTISVEGLWMGVPVLTLAGQSFLSRQGLGLLMNAGLPDWVAKDAEDYVEQAALHASDLPRLAALRVGLRQQVLASPIFDAPRFAYHFEAALRGIWHRWCDQQGQPHP